MLTLGERIRYLRSSVLKLNQSAFAGKLGFSRVATISDYEKNKRSPDTDSLKKIAELSNVCLHWLLTGKGPIFTCDEVREAGKADQAGQPVLVMEELSDVRIYNASEARGPRDFPGALPAGVMPVPRSDYQRGPVAIRVKGDSMAPTIVEGAVVGIDVLYKNLVNGGLFAVWLGNGVEIRRIFVHPDRIVLKADNPAVAETVYPAGSAGEEFVIGKVVWIHQRL